MEYSVEAKIQILYGVCLFDNFQNKDEVCKDYIKFTFLTRQTF